MGPLHCLSVITLKCPPLKEFNPGGEEGGHLLRGLLQADAAQVQGGGRAGVHPDHVQGQPFQIMSMCQKIMVNRVVRILFDAALIHY